MHENLKIFEIKIEKEGYCNSQQIHVRVCDRHQ